MKTDTQKRRPATKKVSLKEAGFYGRDARCVSCVYFDETAFKCGRGVDVDFTEHPPESCGCRFHALMPLFTSGSGSPGSYIDNDTQG